MNASVVLTSFNASRLIVSTIRSCSVLSYECGSDCWLRAGFLWKPTIDNNRKSMILRALRVLATISATY